MTYFKELATKPSHPPGFFCLFCRWNLNQGGWGKKYENFTSLLQHLGSAKVRCCDEKIHFFYKKQYQHHRKRLFEFICSQGCHNGDAPVEQVRPAIAALGKYNPNPHIPTLSTTHGICDRAAPEFSKASAPEPPEPPRPSIPKTRGATFVKQELSDESSHRGTASTHSEDVLMEAPPVRPEPPAKKSKKSAAGLSSKERAKHTNPCLMMSSSLTSPSKKTSRNFAALKLRSLCYHALSLTLHPLRRSFLRQGLALFAFLRAPLLSPSIMLA